MPVPYDIKQVLVFRKDLKVRKGKFASQIAHACMKVFFDRKVGFKDRDGNPLPILGVVIPCPPGDDPTAQAPHNITILFPPESLLVMSVTPEMKEWADTIYAKVVLLVDTEADLLRAYQLAQEAGLPCSLVTDVGNTEFKAPCPDCGGDGYFKGPRLGDEPCPTCGGTGKIGVPTNTAISIGPAATVEIDKITGPNGLVKTELA